MGYIYRTDFILKKAQYRILGCKASLFISGKILMAQNGIREILQDITAASRGARSGIQGKGRMKRTPDFTKPRISSTRPKSDRGVTFHFAHKTISKRGDVSESQKDATSAPSHQLYIERLEAVEISEDDLKNLAQTSGLSRPREPRHDGTFVYPEIVIEPGRESFGTLGETKASRADFWRSVETSEGRSARVQSRIIAELPHEVSQKERVMIAMDFCRSFAQRELPFWATIHSPTKANDRRNYHLHIAYYDRPSSRSETGEWDFATVRTRIKPNRSRVEFRPFKQNKSAEVRNRNWVRELRYEFAESNNNILQNGPYEKRLDPRSYKESGIAKSPTEHLGFKSNAAEKFGLETTRGRRNSKKEFEWRITAAVTPWDDLMGEHDASLLFQDFTDKDADWKLQKDTKEKLRQGRTLASNAVKLDLIEESVTLRVKTRKSFLDSERLRVNKNEKLRTDPDSQHALSLIEIESAVLKNRMPEIEHIVSLIQSKAESIRTEEKVLWDDLKPKVSIGESSFDESIFDGIPTYPLTAGFDRTAPESDEVDPFASDPIPESISDLFETEEEQEADTRSYTEKGSVPQKEEPELLAQERSTETTPAASAPKIETSEPTIPGTLLVPDINTRSELRALNEQLMAMTNREVRVRAITSRDAAEFLDPGEERLQAKRGWILLRSEAEKRGVSLETGRQDLKIATDQGRALLHRDEGQETVLEIREEVIRVMSR